MFKSSEKKYTKKDKSKKNISESSTSPLLPAKLVSETKDELKREEGSSSWVRGKKNEEKKPKDRKISQERQKTTENIAGKSRRETHQIEIFNKNISESGTAQNIAEALKDETELDHTSAPLKLLEITSTIFDPFVIEWRSHVLPDKVEKVKEEWKERVGFKNLGNDQLLIIAVNYTHYKKWQIAFYESKNKSLEEEKLISPNISPKSVPEKEFIEIEVLPATVLYRLLDAKSQSSAELTREEALILTNAVSQELGKLPRVPLFRPLSWTSQDLADYILLISLLQQRINDKNLKKRLDSRYKQAVELAQTMVKKADFGQCINEEKCGLLIQELLPLANCGDAELYRLVLTKIVEYYADGNITISLTALEGIAYLLRFGASQVLLWKQTREEEIVILKNMITKIWIYIQEEYEAILSQDQEIFQYYYLTLLTTLADFAVSIHLDKLKDEFKEIVEEHLTRYKGTHKAYDVEYLAEYYKGALQHIETDLSQATQWIRQFKQVLKFAVVIKDFVTFQWDASDFDNLLEGMKSVFDAGKAITNLVDESIGLKNESNLKVMYSRIRYIRDTLDMLSPSAFIKLFSEKNTIYQFLKKLLAPTLTDQKEAKILFKEAYTILHHLENRLTTGNAKEVAAAFAVLEVLQEMSHPSRQNQAPENSSTTSEAWHMIIDPEEKKIMLARLDNLYALAESHVKNQAKYFGQVINSKNIAREEDLWSRLATVLAQRSLPETEKTEGVSGTPQPIKIVSQLPSAEESAENTLYLSYNDDATSLHYGFKGEKNTWKSSKIEASECKSDELQALGLLKVKISKNSLPPHGECVPSTFYLHLIGSNYVEHIKIKFCLSQSGKKEVKQEEFSLNDLQLERQNVEFTSILKKLSFNSKSLVVKALLSHPKLREFRTIIESQRKISPGNNAYQIIEKKIARQQESFLTMLKRQGQQLWVNTNAFMGKQIEKQALRLYKPQQLKLTASASLLVQVYKSDYRLAYDIEQMLLQQKVEVYGEGELSGIGKELESYIAAKVTDQHLPHPEESQLKSLDEEVKTFLKSVEHQESYLFLLQGDSGMGKSLFLRYLENQQWQSYENLFLEESYQDVIPLYIPLANLPDPNYRAVQQVLEQKGWSEESINTVMTQQKENEVLPPKVIILLDGYDEINTRRNIFESNQLAQWRESKVFLTSRIGYADAAGYQRYFEKNRGKKSNFIAERYLAPFIESQRKEYIAKQVTRLRAQGEESWSVEDYEARFKQVEILNQLARTPFLLSILVQVLPEFPKDQFNLTRAKIFAQFLKHWFRNAEHRIEKHALPERYDLQGSFLSYTYELAKTMWLENRVAVSYKRPGFKTYLRQGQDPWSTFFGTKEENLHAWVGYTGSPVRTINNKVRFVHKSVQEYGVAFALYQTLKSYRRQLQRVEKGSVTLLSVQHVFNQKTLSEDPEIVSFLSEMLEEERKEWCHLLLDIVRQSRDEAHGEAIQIAAGNAMTVLNALNYSFSYEDLTGIKIPGARLEGGNFYRTKFTNSDLRNVHLARAYLVEANFTGCQMEGVDLDALPSLTWEQNRSYLIPQGKTFQTATQLVHVRITKEKMIAVILDKEKLIQNEIKLEKMEGKVTKTSLSPNGQILVFVYVGGTIAYWDLSESESKCVVLRAHNARVRHLLFSKDSNLLISADEKGGLFCWNLQKNAMRKVELKGHENKVIDQVIFSPDDQILLSADLSGNVIYRDIRESVATKDLLLNTPPKRNSLGLIFSADGNTLASIDGYNILRWRRGELEPHSVALSGDGGPKIIFSPDKQRVVFVDIKNTLFIQNIWENEPKSKILKGLRFQIKFFYFSNDSQILIVADKEGNLCRYDLQKDESIGTIVKGPHTEITQLLFTSDRNIIVGDKDGLVVYFNLNKAPFKAEQLARERGEIKGLWVDNNNPNRLVILSAYGLTQLNINQEKVLKSSAALHTTSIIKVNFIPDHKYMISTSTGKYVIWESETGKALMKSEKLDSDFIPDVTFFSSPSRLDSKEILINERGKKYLNVDLNRVPLQRIERNFPTYSRNYIKWSPDGKILVVGDYNGNLFCWKLKDGALKTVPLLQTENGNEFGSFTLTFSPDGQRLIALSKLKHGDRLLCWDMHKPELQAIVLKGHQGSIFQMLFSPDSKILVATTANPVALFCWNIAENEPKGMLLNGCKNFDCKLVFNANGNILITIDSQGNLLRWKMFNPEPEVMLLKWQDCAIEKWILSHDGRMLISGDSKGNLLCWDIQKPESKPIVLQGHNSKIEQLILGPSGFRIVSLDDKGNLFWWDLQEGKQRCEVLCKDATNIRKLIFSPDGKRLVSGGINGEIFCWDITEIDPKKSKLNGHHVEIDLLWFSHDGKKLASTDISGLVFLWYLDVKEFKGKAFKERPHGKRDQKRALFTEARIKEISFDQNNEILITIGNSKVLCWDSTSSYPYSQDFFTLQSWPPFTEKKSTKPLSRYFQVSIDNHSHFEIYEEGKLVQTLYFPRPIYAWDVTSNGEMLIVASDNMLFCWQYEIKEKQYTLLWDDGDALLCQGTLFKNVSELSESNSQLFKQYGAIISSPEKSSPSLRAKAKEPTVVNFPEILAPEELASIEKQLAEIKKQKQVLKQKIYSHYQGLTNYSRLTLFEKSSRQQEVKSLVAIENKDNKKIEDISDVAESEIMKK